MHRNRRLHEKRFHVAPGKSGKRSSPSEWERLEISALISQWARLCEYVEKLDTDHWHVFTVIFAAFGLFSVIGNKVGNGLFNNLKWIIPLVIMMLLYYEAYRLREVAVLKGYLARLELTINRKLSSSKGQNLNASDGCDNILDESFHMYYSYENVFFWNNNRANAFLPIPIVLTIVIIHLIYYFNASWLNNKYVYGVFIGAIIVLDMVAFVSIMNNMRAFYIAAEKDIAKQARKYKCEYSKWFKTTHFQTPNSIMKHMITLKSTIYDFWHERKNFK